MSLRGALVERLVAAATPAGDSVSFFGRARGDPLPALVLMLVTPGEDWTHDGPDGLDEPRLRVDCYAGDDAGCDALAGAVKTEMRRSVTAGGYLFHEASLEADRDLDNDEEEGGQPLFRIQLEFLFYVEETS